MENQTKKNKPWLQWAWNGFGVVGCAVVLLVFIGVTCCGGLVVLSMSSDGSGDASLSLTGFSDVKEKILDEGSSKDKIAVVSLVGEIGSPDSSAATQQFMKGLEYAANKDDIKKVIALIDSPGGEVVASEMLYSKIREVTKTKEVTVYIRSMGASGGYYTALGAETIYIHPSGITGSIGVITQVMSLDGLYSKLGIDVRTFKTGRFKDSSELFDNNPNGEAEQIYKSIIDDSYQTFVNVVSERRKLPRDTVLKLADGRIYTARLAQEAKLVDKLGTFDEVVKAVRTKSNTQYKVVQVEVSPDLFSSLGLFARSMAIALHGEGTQRTKVLYLYQ